MRQSTQHPGSLALVPTAGVGPSGTGSSSLGPCKEKCLPQAQGYPDSKPLLLPGPHILSLFTQPELVICIIFGPRPYTQREHFCSAFHGPFSQSPYNFSPFPLDSRDL